MKRPETGILRIKRKKFGDEVLVLYMYDGEVVYAYSPFSGEAVRVKNVMDFLNDIVKSYRWDLTHEFTVMSESELAAVLKVPGIRYDGISKKISGRLKELLDGIRGVWSYGVFDRKGYLITGYNLNPSTLREFSMAYENIKKMLRKLDVNNVNFFLTKHSDRVFSLFLPINDEYFFFFIFEESHISMGYVVSSLVHEIKEHLEKVLVA